MTGLEGACLHLKYSFASVHPDVLCYNSGVLRWQEAVHKSPEQIQITAIDGRLNQTEATEKEIWTG